MHVRFAQQGSIEAPHAWQLKPMPPMLPAQTKPMLQVPPNPPVPPQHPCPMPPHGWQVPPFPPPTPPWHPRPVLHTPPVQQA